MSVLQLKLSIKKQFIYIYIFHISIYYDKCHSLTLSFLNVSRYAGQVGTVSCNIKSREAFIGDTMHLKDHTVEPLETFNPPKPMVFAGVYPIDQTQYPSLQAAIDKLVLNDSAVQVTLDSRYTFLSV